MRHIGRLLTTVVLVLLFLVFAWANLKATLQDGSPTGAGLTLLVGWTAVLFLTRRRGMRSKGPYRLVRRIGEEEGVLRSDAEYRSHTNVVRTRLVPFAY